MQPSHRCKQRLPGDTYLILGLPHPRTCFFEQPVLQGQVGYHLLQCRRPLLQILNLDTGGLAGRIPGKRLLPSFEELFRTTVIKAPGDPFAVAQLHNAVFAAQSLKYNTDLLLSRMLTPGLPADVFDDLLSHRVLLSGFHSRLGSLTATMSLKVSVTQSLQSVPCVLTGYKVNSSVLEFT